MVLSIDFDFKDKKEKILEIDSIQKAEKEAIVFLQKIENVLRNNQELSVQKIAEIRNQSTALSLALIKMRRESGDQLNTENS